MKKINLVGILLILFAFTVKAEVSDYRNIEKQTFIYSIKGADTLRLDTYNDQSVKGVKPCVVFVFGGGFKGGDRHYSSEYLQRLALNGFVAVGIDYRLGLKDISTQAGATPEMVANLLASSIMMAVEDLYDATKFTYDNAEEWGIDKTKIIANGSSAGGVTVLQAEYMLCNESDLSMKLPKDFRYAGIISFAGAIFDPAGVMTWKNKPSPLQLFHGDADKNVPFDKLEMFGAGIYGSKYIAEQLSVIESPYYFYEVENAAHEIAELPMQKNMDEIRSFIYKFITKKQPLIIHSKVEEIGKPEMKKDFTVMDFIQSNYE